MKKRYYYNGPVQNGFKKNIGSFSGETMAESMKEARRNLTYQCKKERGLSATAKIVLSGDIKCAE